MRLNFFFLIEMYKRKDLLNVVLFLQYDKLKKRRNGVNNNLINEAITNYIIG